MGRSLGMYPLPIILTVTNRIGSLQQGSRALEPRIPGRYPNQEQLLTPKIKKAWRTDASNKIR